FPSHLGTALGVSSISWTWGAITGAQTYNLYYATGTLVASGLTGTSTNEVGLSTNIAYGRQLTAVVNGIESALSPITTVYTMAARSEAPMATNVGYSSFTVRKSANQNRAQL